MNFLNSKLTWDNTHHKNFPPPTTVYNETFLVILLITAISEIQTYNPRNISFLTLEKAAFWPYIQNELEDALEVVGMILPSLIRSHPKMSPAIAEEKESHDLWKARLVLKHQIKHFGWKKESMTLGDWLELNAYFVCLKDYIQEERESFGRLSLVSDKDIYEIFNQILRMLSIDLEHLIFPILEKQLHSKICGFENAILEEYGKSALGAGEQWRDGVIAQAMADEVQRIAFDDDPLKEGKYFLSAFIAKREPDEYLYALSSLLRFKKYFERNNSLRGEGKDLSWAGYQFFKMLVKVLEVEAKEMWAGTMRHQEDINPFDGWSDINSEAPAKSPSDGGNQDFSESINMANQLDHTQLEAAASEDLEYKQQELRRILGIIEKNSRWKAEKELYFCRLNLIGAAVGYNNNEDTWLGLDGTGNPDDEKLPEGITNEILNPDPLEFQDDWFK
ncbi:hypothetical protein BGZ60DRAFT_430875 [Tricladium varicosporioides]|nr:hypothetical protein BGZ60DRAFT_430875 [Hymenoscyphus varicosporioides]